MLSRKLLLSLASLSIKCPKKGQCPNALVAADATSCEAKEDSYGVQANVKCTLFFTAARAPSEPQRIENLHNHEQIKKSGEKKKLSFESPQGSAESPGLPENPGVTCIVSVFSFGDPHIPQLRDLFSRLYPPSEG